MCSWNACPEDVQSPDSGWASQRGSRNAGVLKRTHYRKVAVMPGLGERAVVIGGVRGGEDIRALSAVSVGLDAFYGWGPYRGESLHYVEKSAGTLKKRGREFPYSPGSPCLSNPQPRCARGCARPP